MTITTVNPADATPRADATVPSQRTEYSAPPATTTTTAPNSAPTTRPRTSRPEMSSEDLDAQSPAADLVRVYLNGIGKTALLTAAQEVDLARRIEAGVFAQHVLDAAKEEAARSSGSTPPTCAPSCATATPRATTCSRPTCGWSCRWPSATPAAACPCWT